MKKNIIYITGNDSYGVELEIKRWLGTFENKYGSINIDRYDLSDGSNLKWIGEIILMWGIFLEKRLFIFRGGRDRKSKTPWIEEILEKKSNDIPDDHFLLFHDIWSKEEGLISWLEKNADTRKIDTLWDKKIWEMRSNIDFDRISLVLATYANEEKYRDRNESNPFLWHSIYHTLETISLLNTANIELKKDDIIQFCYGFDWATTFWLSDAIVNMNIPLCIHLCNRIANTNNDSSKWLTGLIWALSNHITIKYLKHHWYKENEIAQIIKIHPFALKNWYWSRIWYPELKKIYEKLIDINIAYKRGKWLKDTELWRILSIELALLSLQKWKNL